VNPSFVVAGRLSREYLLPPVGPARLDAPGGNLLYAAGGLAVWEQNLGLVGRVGEDYPRQWLDSFEQRGMDTRGIRILPQALDLRSFLAYDESLEPQKTTPVAHFARRQLTFPKSLLGYQPPSEETDNGKHTQLDSPTAADIPSDYLEASAVHICPLSLASQTQLLMAFKSGTATTLSLDPSPAYMVSAFLKSLRALLKGLTVFLPSQTELRALFWGKTHDLWEMAEALSAYGCELVVIKSGGLGQLLYDSPGQHRWEIPAYPARMADPTGAGDAFCGGFLAGYHKHYDPLEAVLYGNVSASLKVEGSGAFYPLDVLPGLAQARLDSLKELVREV
jgi:sugar/nucleoside kinase (ribokinase family)